MAIRNIVKVGDEILTKKCRPVTEYGPRLWLLLDDMRDTLTAAQGAGLAGPQVGILRRVALVMQEDGRFLEIINPEIIDREGEQDGPEGCLSVPGKYGMVKRPMKVTVKFQDRNGKWNIRSAQGFTARAFCHEIEHLDGHLYTELVSRYLEPEELGGGDGE